VILYNVDKPILALGCIFSFEMKTYH